MAKIKNVSGEARTVPGAGGRLVLDGQVIEVPVEDVYLYTQQTIWEPADDESQSVHDEEEARYAPLVEAQGDESNEPPARNASRDDWAAWVVAQGLVPDLEALDGQGRDLIRDTYSPEEN